MHLLTTFQQPQHPVPLALGQHTRHKTSVPGHFLQGFTNIIKHSDAPGCCTLQTEQRVLSTHRRYPVWSEADTSVQSHSLFRNSLNQKKATCRWKVNVHFSLLWWPNLLHKNLTSSPGIHWSKQQCRQGCQYLPYLLPTDPAWDTEGWPLSQLPRGREGAVPHLQQCEQKDHWSVICSYPLKFIMESQPESPTAQSRPRYRARPHRTALAERERLFLLLWNRCMHSQNLVF